MDELRGPNIQIILHVKEGIGFGFLKTPFMVSGTLNGYMLETDPAVPCHAPIFDAELVWEADKRRFRSLRVQNVPVKVEVYTLGTQGHKDKVGYLLLSLLGAQPCPANKIVDVKHTWHKLLGVKSAGKCCHPQLMISLTVEDRVNMLTPRNELRMFHTNEMACPTNYNANNIPTNKNILKTINEYIAESKKTVSSPDLQPKLICEEGLIQIGNDKQLFVLSFVIGSLENLDLLLPDSFDKEEMKCYVSYSVFTHNITTDRVEAQWAGPACAARCWQRSSLRVRASLSALAAYFAQCPSLVATLVANDIQIGICSIDLRKLIPTDDVNKFVTDFCNSDNALLIQERCFILPFDEDAGSKKVDTRRPYMDMEMSLKYVGEDTKKTGAGGLSARSAVQLEGARAAPTPTPRRVASCADLAPAPRTAYTAPAPANTDRYKNASGECMLQTNEITELIKKMYESYTQSQEKLLAKSKTTSDMQVQCDHVQDQVEKTKDNEVEREPLRLETSKSDPCIQQNDKAYIEMVKASIPAAERDGIMQKFVDELEDWKERQQELYKIQLQRKEDYHLEILSTEWTKKRLELESKLSKGIEQCRTLAADLSRATDDFRLRGYRNTEREKKLLEAKKALEAHYTAKYQELREASQKMEDDMNHQLKMKEMRIEELEMNVVQLNKQVDVLKNNLHNNEKDVESKYSGLTKDQTASLIQELRCLEEKLESAVQSKAFFKEQWGRAVRELHAAKLRTRTLALLRLRSQRRNLRTHGSDIVEDPDESDIVQNDVDINKLKDDFYVDILANTPALDSHTMMSTSVPDMTGLDDFENFQKAPKNLLNDKLSELITQRDDLIQQENPDEDLIKQLNHDIRSMLLNCGS